VSVLRRTLRPVADAGTMTLTLDGARLVVIATGLLQDQPAALLIVMVSAVGFATVWRRRHGKGPMEQVVSTVAGRAHRTVAGRRASPGAGPV
jgi:hypothetical protein